MILRRVLLRLENLQAKNLFLEDLLKPKHLGQ